MDWTDSIVIRRNLTLCTLKKHGQLTIRIKQSLTKLCTLRVAMSVSWWKTISYNRLNLWFVIQQVTIEQQQSWSFYSFLLTMNEKNRSRWNIQRKVRESHTEWKETHIHIDTHQSNSDCKRSERGSLTSHFICQVHSHLMNQKVCVCVCMWE
jgi:hypothetical protein